MDTMTEQIVRLLRERCMVQAQDMTAQTALSALDLDSLTLLEVTLHLEREFGTVVEPRDLVDTQTIGDLARLVESRLAA